jgi:integrase
VIAGELRHVRGSDIVERSGGVIVAVSGQRARSVPVSERYQQRLLQAAAFAGDRYVIGGRNPDRRNVTDTLSATLSTDSSLPRLQAGRLRSTWLVECAERIGLGVFMQAAGITCSQRLGDLAAQLPAVSEDELVAILGATA